MPNRVHPFTVQCPKKTTQANAVEVATAFDPGIVQRVDITFPAGHAYKTGIAVAVAHSVVIPHRSTTWLIGDGETHSYQVSEYPDSGAWSVYLFNTDPVYAHSWQVRYHVRTLPKRRPHIVITPIAPELIYAAAGASRELP